MKPSDLKPSGVKPSGVKSLPVFDPRSVPVQRVDGHLPKLPASQLQAASIKALFRSPKAWTPEFQAEPRFTDKPMAPAAVLLGLVQRASGLHVLLTERSHRLKSHAGQISFPGGKVDTGDTDRIATALRETEEEVGLTADWIDVLGCLPHYTTGSAFVVTPVLALIAPGFSLRPNAQEVASVFEVPLPFLMDPANHRHHAVVVDGVARHWLSMPYREHADGTEYFIWGATAGMLRNLYQFLRDAGGSPAMEGRSQK